MIRPQSTDNRSSRGSILLVDDEPSILTLLKIALQRSGRRCREAPDGAAALAVFWEHHRDIDLIVTDVHMPRLNGLSLVKRAREIAPQIKVVVQSGGLDPAERKKVEELDVTAFLEKPYSASAMLTCVEDILEQGK